jgi:hypothetical protein
VCIFKLNAKQSARDQHSFSATLPKGKKISNTLMTGEQMDQRASVDATADYQVPALL